MIDRNNRNIDLDLAKFEEINTMEELEAFTEKLFIDNLGFVPFYVEVKPGFGNHANAILRDLLVQADENNKDDIQINLLAKSCLRRTEEFNRAFYPHLLNLPNGIFDTLNNYMLGKMENPYTGKPLETYDRGGNIGFILFGDNKKVIDKARLLQGSTGNPAEGTIRYKYGLCDIAGNLRPNKTANVLHCSDSCVSAIKELYMAIANPQKFGAYSELLEIPSINIPKILDVIYLTSMVSGAIKEKEQEIVAIQNGQKQEKTEGKTTTAQKRLAQILKENSAKKSDAKPVTPVNDGREGK